MISTFDDDEEPEDEMEVLYTEIDDIEDEIEDEEEIQPYRQGLVDYLLRKINSTADKLW